MALLVAVSALALVFLVQGLLTAVELAKAKAQLTALEKDLVKVRSDLVLAKAREWEFHRESGKHLGMD